jgi:hypothetical protein
VVISVLDSVEFAKLFGSLLTTGMTFREVKGMNLNYQSGLLEISWTLTQGKLW